MSSAPTGSGKATARTATAESAGEATAVYRWDLDKTYLQTDFHSLRGMLRAVLEAPADKRPVPGMRALLRALSAAREARIVVVSGSPEMLRGRIDEMFALHGLHCDRLVLKRWAAAIGRGRFASLRGQLAYKLRAHLETRAWLCTHGADAPEYCFGDDAEIDGLVYCLYADACARRLDATRLRRLLLRGGAYEDEVREILERLAELPRHDPVRRVFIHLDAHSPPDRFRPYRGRVTPTFDAFQIAVCLADGGHAGDEVVAAVADSLVSDHRIDANGLAGSLEDACGRGLCRIGTAERLAGEVLTATRAADVGFDADFAARSLRRLRDLPAARPEPAEPGALRYEELVADEAAFAAARRLARRAAKRLDGMRAFLEGRR